jgi:hypothetical protein
MENFNHKHSDFIKALNLDKDEILQIVKNGIKIHIIDGEPISKCITEMVKEMKGSQPSDVKFVVVGIIFSEIISTMKLKTSIKDIMGSTIINEVLPFNADDLRKSIRDELDSRSNNTNK